jgi:hypothetical protein
MIDDNDRKKQKAFFQEWLEKLQQESWQLELLISGFALYGVYGSKPAIIEFGNYIDVASADGIVATLAGFAVTILKAGWALFFINLLVHIILRGLWIGAIGLRYVSREIDYDALNYSEWMTNYLRRKVGSYDDYIERLEKLCSVLFAYTFLLFFLVVSTMVFVGTLGLFGFVANKLVEESILGQGVFSLFMMGYLLCALVVFFDFITLGLIRRIKDPTFAKGYGFLYRFFSYITLSFLYRALLYNFLDDKYTRRLFLLGIPYVFTVLIISPSLYTNGNSVIPDSTLLSNRMYDAAVGNMIQHRFYDDLRGLDETPTAIKALSIDRYAYDDRDMMVFIRIDQDFDEVISKEEGLEPIFKVGFHSTFGRAVHKSAVVDSIKDLEAVLLEPLVQAKVKERKLLKEQGLYNEDSKEALRVAYQSRFDSVEYVVDQMVTSYYSDQFGRIKAAIVNRIELVIDDTALDINPDDLLFTKHANLGEKGVLFHVPLDSLSRGLHRLYFQRYEGDLDSRSFYSKEYDGQTLIPFYIK